ncbi:MAG: hypothetical protein ACJ735_14230 [Actinomycetes bacterium]
MSARATFARRRWLLSVPALAVGVALAAPAWAARHDSVVDRRTAAVAQALDRSAHGLHLHGWSTVSTSNGPRWEVTVPTVGLVQVDARTGEVDEVIFEGQLTGAAGPIVAATGVRAVAASFASRHYQAFSSLVSRGQKFIDHGDWAEYRVEWQGRSGAAWVPSDVAVGINARTGRVAYFYSDRTPVRIATTPGVGAKFARRAAARAAGATKGSHVSAAELSVEVANGRQILVWVVSVQAPRVLTPHVPNDKVVWVDANSGVANVWATT